MHLACQQWCLRRLLSRTRLQRVTNTEVLRRTNQTQLSTVLCDKYLRLFRHVARSDARMDHSRALCAVISGLRPNALGPVPRNFLVANVTRKSPTTYELVTRRLATFRPSRHVRMVWRVANFLVTFATRKLRGTGPSAIWPLPSHWMRPPGGDPDSHRHEPLTKIRVHSALACTRHADELSIVNDATNRDSGYAPSWGSPSMMMIMSKIVERLVCHQLVAFLERLRLLPSPQSAYGGKHSTETAVLKIISDVLRAADRGEVSLLCMLDLSAAFDTVDHDILIDRIRQSFGVQGLALTWIESFLRDRTQSVCVAGISQRD